MSEPLPPKSPLHPLVGQAYQNLESKAKTYLPTTSVEKIKVAFEFADQFHIDQCRASGEPYIVHPLSVATLLADLKMDETSLVAAILHDVVEDTHASVEQVSNKFGKEVAALVDGLTKLAKVEFRSSQEKLAENFRKMIVAMSKDIRVIIIKLADRLHNMMTIKALAKEKRTRISEETLEIYAPIAGRLGIYKIKAELEDLTLKELKPDVYSNLGASVAKKKTVREKMIQDLSTQLKEKLSEAVPNAVVEGRFKHFYSIYKKMVERKMAFEDIYDLFGVRMYVDTVAQCYEALGVVHNNFRPVPGRFKDYIAMPKANLYQSLHTTVVTSTGDLLEVQIRTWDMHHVCEYGIAAHWVYKETRRDGCKKETLNSDLEKFGWLKQIFKHQKEISDPNEFMEAVKVDLFEEEVYVFSPKGDVYELTNGSTVLDFAFAIHSDLGLKTVGAKINGRIASLRTKLNSGDVVEILAATSIRASKDWLSFVVTNKAKNKIRGYLRTEERDEARQIGIDLLTQAFEHVGSNLEDEEKAGVFQDVNQVFSVGGYEDLILQVGYGKLNALEVAQKLTGKTTGDISEKTAQRLKIEELLQYEKAPLAKSHSSSNKSPEDSIKVQGNTGILVRIAKCCEPLPGQAIVGYVSRGRGVTVHATNCPWALSNDPARKVECAWNIKGSGEHIVRLRLTTKDQAGILANVTKTISAFSINIIGAEIQTTPDGRGIMVVKMRISDIKQLKDVQQKLEGVEGVLFVERLTG